MIHSNVYFHFFLLLSFNQNFFLILSTKNRDDTLNCFLLEFFPIFWISCNVISIIFLHLLLLSFLALSPIFSMISLIYFAITTPFPSSFPSSFPISTASYTPAVVLPLFLPFLYFALPLLLLLGNILDDTVLIETLAQSKNTSEDINEKLREASLITIEISVQSELYRPVAKRWVEYSYF